MMAGAKMAGDGDGKGGNSGTGGSDPNEIVSQVLEKGLVSLLENSDIKAAVLHALRNDAGLPGWSAHVLLYGMKLAVAAGQKYASDKIKTTLLSLVEDYPLLVSVLEKLAAAQLRAKEKSELKELLLAELDEVDSETARSYAKADLDAVIALHNRGKLEDLDETVAGLADEIMDKLENLLRDMTKPDLLVAGMEGNWECNSKRLSASEQLRYNSGLYGFHGRDAELEILSSFLEAIYPEPHINRFRWMFITGPGGEGKSRLALEFCKKLSDGPWHAGKLSLRELKVMVDGQFDWRPRRPTLFVIDYPAQKPELVGAFLSSLNRDWRTFDLPVRVLMLERDATGEWHRQMLPENSESQAVRDHMFKPSPVALKHLSRDALIDIMKERFTVASIEPPDDDTLFLAASAIDPRGVTHGQEAPKPRALFAAAVAQVMVSAATSGEDPVAAASSLDRNGIFESLVKRDRDTRWRPVDSAGSAVLEKHENLLALATMSIGLSRAALNLPDLKPLCGEILPQDIDIELLQAMGSDDPLHRVSPLEPDLLGEYFALSRISALHLLGIKQKMIDAAFRSGGDNFANFCLKCLKDFPDRSRQLQIHIPSPEMTAEAATAFAALTANFTFSHTRSEDDEEIDTLMLLLDSYRELYSEDVKLAYRDAVATSNIACNAGSVRNWERVDAMLKRLDGLQAKFQHDRQIALRAAVAAFNCANEAGRAGEISRERDMFDRMDALRRTFPDDSNIAVREARAAANAVDHAGAKESWIDVESMLKRIVVLRSAFPRDRDIAVQEAKAAVNTLYHCGQNRDWLQIDRLFKVIEQLRTSFHADQEIALCHAKAAVNFTHFASKAEDWIHVKNVLHRMDAMRAEFPGDDAIALQVAMVYCNAIEHSANAESLSRAGDLCERIAALSEVFPDHAGIRGWVGYAASTIYHANRKAGYMIEEAQSQRAAIGALAYCRIAGEGDRAGHDLCLTVINDAVEQYPSNAEIAKAKEIADRQRRLASGVSSQVAV